MPGQRQRRQPQPRRPALGPLMQHRQRRLGQLHPGRREQLPRLGQGEPQIGRADLGQLTLQPQPVQPQPQVMPGGQHEPQLRRGAHHQQLQLPQRLGRAQLVHVIDHQPEPVRQRRQVLQQPLHDRPPVQVRRRRQLPHQPRPRSRLAQRARAPTARTAADPARRAPPAPTRRAPPAPPRRSRTAAGPSSRSPPAPTPPSPAPTPEPPEQPRTRNDSSRTRAAARPDRDPDPWAGPMAHHRTTPVREVDHQPPTSAVTSRNSGLLDPHRSHHHCTHAVARLPRRSADQRT